MENEKLLPKKKMRYNEAMDLFVHNLLLEIKVKNPNLLPNLELLGVELQKKVAPKWETSGKTNYIKLGVKILLFAGIMGIGGAAFGAEGKAAFESIFGEILPALLGGEKFFGWFKPIAGTLGAIGGWMYNILFNGAASNAIWDYYIRSEVESTLITPQKRFNPKKCSCCGTLLYGLEVFTRKIAYLLISFIGSLPYIVSEKGFRNVTFAGVGIPVQNFLGAQKLLEEKSFTIERKATIEALKRQRNGLLALFEKNPEHAVFCMTEALNKIEGDQKGKTKKWMLTLLTLCKPISNENSNENKDEKTVKVAPTPYQSGRIGGGIRSAIIFIVAILAFIYVLGFVLDAGLAGFQMTTGKEPDAFSKLSAGKKFGVLVFTALMLYLNYLPNQGLANAGKELVQNTGSKQPTLFEVVFGKLTGKLLSIFNGIGASLSFGSGTKVVYGSLTTSPEAQFAFTETTRLKVLGPASLVSGGVMLTAVNAYYSKQGAIEPVLLEIQKLRLTRQNHENLSDEKRYLKLLLTFMKALDKMIGLLTDMPQENYLRVLKPLLEDKELGPILLANWMEQGISTEHIRKVWKDVGTKEENRILPGKIEAISMGALLGTPDKENIDLQNFSNLNIN